MPKKPLIFIVEDEKALVKAMQIKLRDSGFDIMVAYDGAQALAEIKKKKPDLILLDILLPKLSGIDFLREIRSKKQWQKIPVVVISNYSAEETVKEGFGLKISDYLIKSDVSLDGIIKKVKKLIK